MSHLPLALAEDVRRATQRVRRLGNTQGLLALEHWSPDLAEVLMEEAGLIHRRLARSRLPDVLVRQLTRRIERLGLLLVFAQEQALLRQHAVRLADSRPDRFDRHP